MTQEVYIFKEENLPPLKSQNTWMIAAAMASGICLSKTQSFVDTVEIKQDGGKHRVTTWICDSEPAQFDPYGPPEKVTPDQFSKRYLDSDWCAKNNNHPIAYMRHFAETYQKLRSYLKTHQPSALIRRNGKIAVIDANCPQALKEKILARL
jgi:hypothetical protein